MKHLQKFPIKKTFEQDSNYIMDRFLSVSDKWRLGEATNLTKDEKLQKLSTTNIYSYWLDESHPRYKKVIINIDILSNISNIVHTTIDFLYGTTMENPERFLDKKFISDLKSFTDSIHKHYKNEKDEKDIMYKRHIRKMVDLKSSSDDDIRELMKLSSSVNIDKIHSSIRYLSDRYLFMRETNPLYPFRAADGNTYEFNIRIEFSLGKFR